MPSPILIIALKNLGQNNCKMKVFLRHTFLLCSVQKMNSQNAFLINPYLCCIMSLLHQDEISVLLMQNSSYKSHEKTTEAEELMKYLNSTEALMFLCMFFLGGYSSLRSVSWTLLWHQRIMVWDMPNLE
ncbi:hypothetical protein XENTR_v10019228 [Xenopus tropicalis]|nr:hypothetical protein XENTR_v10019228 [Xenopus tropicalis]